jgi:hypothetical protein
MIMNELEMFVGRGVPVIVLIQAWREKNNFYKEWVDIWDNGHYVVVIEVDVKIRLLRGLINSRRNWVHPKKECMDGYMA